VALGHTRNDQAETVLFRLLRGAAGAGLAGILPVTAECLVRPLLDVTRTQVEAFLRERGQTWREDSTNRSPQFARNRIRHELLPQLEREWNPGIMEALAHTAEWARAEEFFWREQIDRLAAAHFTRAGDTVLVEAGRLAALPDAVARRLVRRAIELVKGDVLGIGFEHIAAMLTLARLPDGSARFQAGGIDAYRSFDWLRFSPIAAAGDADRWFGLPLQVPGVTRVPAAQLAIHTELVEKSETIRLEEYVYNGREMGCLDWDRVSGPLELRNWRPGDRLQPAGHAGTRKIKELFQRDRIPLWERRNWPVVTDGEAVVWTRRFGPAASYQASSASRVILRLQEQPGIGMGSGGV
jgi:tRNA(Ile)-lysidine synthase